MLLRDRDGRELRAGVQALLPGPESRDTKCPKVPHLIGHRSRDNRRWDAAELVREAGEEIHVGLLLLLLLLRELLRLLLLLAETRKLLHELLRAVESPAHRRGNWQLALNGSKEICGHS